jgi:hypothetical protein
MNYRISLSEFFLSVKNIDIILDGEDEKKIYLKQYGYPKKHLETNHNFRCKR